MSGVMILTASLLRSAMYTFLCYFVVACSTYQSLLALSLSLSLSLSFSNTCTNCEIAVPKLYYETAAVSKLAHATEK